MVFAKLPALTLALALSQLVSAMPAYQKRQFTNSTTTTDVITSAAGTGAVLVARATGIIGTAMAKRQAELTSQSAVAPSPDSVSAAATTPVDPVVATNASPVVTQSAAATTPVASVIATDASPVVTQSAAATTPVASVIATDASPVVAQSTAASQVLESQSIALSSETPSPTGQDIATGQATAIATADPDPPTATAIAEPEPATATVITDPATPVTATAAQAPATETGSSVS